MVLRRCARDPRGRRSERTVHQAWRFREQRTTRAGRSCRRLPRSSEKTLAGRATRTARNVGTDDIDNSTLRKRARREGNSAQHEALRPKRVWTGSMCLARARRRRDPRPRIRFRPLLHLPAAARPLSNRTAHRTRIRATGMRRSRRLQGKLTLSGDRGSAGSLPSPTGRGARPSASAYCPCSDYGFRYWPH